jgi:AraC-like DNA-binding protein/quercetin dioxygenase-like cupin family protein
MPGSGKNIPKTDIFKISPGCREHILPLGLPALAGLSASGLVFAGFGLEKAPYEIRRASPPWDLLLYTLKGRGQVRAGGETFSLDTGSLWLAPRGAAHEYRIAAEDWEIVWCCLDRPSGVARTEVRASDTGEYIKMTMLIITRELGIGGLSGSLQAASELLANYIARELAAPESPDAVKIARLMALMRAAPGRRWSAVEMTRAAGLHVSPDHFIRLFRKTAGVSPRRWLLDRRMEMAAELLRGGQYRVGDIAGLSGYSNPFAFSTAFKRRSGLSPRSLRADSGSEAGGKL